MISSFPSLAALEPLAWDSGHFGQPVARIMPPDPDDVALEALLLRARSDGYRLVYWAAPGDRLVPPPLLSAFGGLLADRKATFVIDDLGLERGDNGPYRIDEAERGAVPFALLALAVAAGEHSRFRRDPRIPEDRFRALYEAWMARSLLGELADAVLVATAADRAGPAGVVTVSVADGVGSIGLIAVDAITRGRGLGRSLVAAAHRWMKEAGASRATVVTQLENAPACALYQRCGYRLGDVRNLHHFWL